MIYVMSYSCLKMMFIRELKSLLLNKVVDGGPAGIKAGGKVTKAYLSDLDKKEWFSLRMKNEDVKQAT